MAISQHSIQVWVVRLAGESVERWRPALSEDEWDRAMRFRQAADQARFAVTRGVLRRLLSGYLGVPAEAIPFGVNEFGKPAVDGGMQFNVAHSGDYALLAFAKEIELGVDVEKLSGERVVSDLARRVLSASEYERFCRVAEGQRLATFYQIWTLKEAVLKGIGSGLSITPEAIEVAFYPDEARLLSCAAKEIEDANEWTVRSLKIGDDHYAAAIAVKCKEPKIEMRFYA
jgi:4'-phosphopantetheinyl transferase